jgi:LacI family transcriptional regulator
MARPISRGRRVAVALDDSRHHTPCRLSNNKKIAIILDPSAARRLVGGIFATLRPGKIFWLLDALRPTEELLAQLHQLKPDGIIMRVMADTNRALLKLGKPAVICGGSIVQRGVSSVSIDNSRVGALAAQHLMSLGLRHFAFFGIQAPFSPERQRGFTATLGRAGHAYNSYEDPRVGWEHYMELLHVADDALERWLRQLPKPVGIFAAHDPLGWHLSQACRQAGLSVPEEVAIVSANNDELVCGLAHPPLSSVAVPWGRVGAEIGLAMDRLLDGVAAGCRRGGTGQLVRVDPEGVVIRQSTNLLAIDHPLLVRAMQFIWQHAGAPITVNDILREVPMSRRKLESDFTRHLGRTPKAEITRVRIERAKLLLAQTDLPIPIVAEQCGYNYAERFTIAFRQHVQSTPSAYRRAHRVK